MENVGAVNFLAPFRAVNSMRKMFWTTSPPHNLIRLSAPCADPPVAIKSSKITTFSPGLMAVLLISKES